uniref:Uncharacterized protein n=1 Tax=Fagus sylvatica TaxID=28930 RepID=A0A2N9FYP3_FAGSY
MSAAAGVAACLASQALSVCVTACGVHSAWAVAVARLLLLQFGSTG